VGDKVGISVGNSEVNEVRDVYRVGMPDGLMVAEIVVIFDGSIVGVLDDDLKVV
jgi:hypothetical protein